MNHFTADDGTRIFFERSGDGRPLILLHGWTGSHQDWALHSTALAESSCVYRWDARGHGIHPQATKGAAPTVSRMARDLKNLFERHALESVDVVGHSMGALTLWQYVADFGTERLRRACFIDQSPKLLTTPEWAHGIYGDFDDARAAAMRHSLSEDFAEAVLKLTALGLNQRARERYLVDTNGWKKLRAALKAQPSDELICCWNSLTAADYRTVLSRIDIPSLLIHGSESNFYRIETAQFVAAQIPNAILHIYEGADHCPHLLQHERFIRDLQCFLSEDEVSTYRNSL